MNARKIKTLVAAVSFTIAMPFGVAHADNVALNPNGIWLTYDEFNGGAGTFFPHSWIASANQIVRITDYLVLGDTYDIFVNSIFKASATSLDYSATGNGAFGSPYTSDPDAAWNTTGTYAFSHASFSVNSGDIITIKSAGLPSGFSDSTVAISAVPVPEPETYAMLLAGLGLLGFAARRRKQAITS